MNEEDTNFFASFTKTKTNLAVVGFLFVGIFILALGVGLFAFKAKQNSVEDIQIISASVSPVAASEIVVDVDGAVLAPGVYKLAKDSRMNDVITAAGGLAQEADRSRINLAAKVLDGQKVYIPVVGGPVGQIAGESVNGPISINSDSQSRLESLPGVGPVTASKIIASRPYSSLEELKTKKAVGSATYEKIKDLISL